MVRALTSDYSVWEFINNYNIINNSVKFFKTLIHSTIL